MIVAKGVAAVVVGAAVALGYVYRQLTHKDSHCEHCHDHHG